jgi:hypothetical protein
MGPTSTKAPLGWLQTPYCFVTQTLMDKFN